VTAVVVTTEIRAGVSVIVRLAIVQLQYLLRPRLLKNRLLN
jgi:hypothetical protein